MTELKRQEFEIENIRRRLHEIVRQKGGDFSDPEVLATSILLDTLIVSYYHSTCLLRPDRASARSFLKARRSRKTKTIKEAISHAGTNRSNTAHND